MSAEELAQFFDTATALLESKSRTDERRLDALLREACKAQDAAAAMAEREAALVARVAELEESFTRAGLAAREAQTKAHEATIALSAAKAEIARLELVQVPALVARITQLEERDMMLTKRIVVYAAERDALRAKVEALRAESGR